MDEGNGNGNGAVRVELAKWFTGMAVAALVSYLGTAAAMKERISLLEQQVVFQQRVSDQKMDYMQQSIDALRDEVRLLRESAPVADAAPVRSGRSARMFDH